MAAGSDAVATLRRNRSGNWEARASLGSDPATGRRRRAQETYPGTLPERDARRLAEDFERRARGAGGEGSAGDGGAMRLSEWLDDYIDMLEALKASPASIPTYRTYADRYICPRIGRLRLMDLRPAHVERMLADVRRRGGVGDGPVELSTLRCVHAFLQGALSKARDYGYMAENPAVKEIRPRADRKEAASLDDADLARLAKAIDGRWDIAAVASRLALGTGLRRAEACGLQWGDIDPASRSLHVSRVAVAKAGGGLVLKDPKSRAGARTLRLDDGTWAWLERWSVVQRDALAELGATQTASTPVVSLNGSHTAPQAVSRGFKALKDEAGVEGRCTYHTLRHTHATHLLREGVDIKVLQRRLGHSSAAITLDTYAHVLPGADDAAADAMAEVLARANRAMGPRPEGGGDAR